LLAGENLAAELTQRNYPEVAIAKILGGNLLRVLPRFRQNQLLVPDDESNR
jgi:microsomal dipeptidase-like Zn-dependent dipeptidase